MAAPPPPPPVSLASGWSRHSTQDGRVYYYHAESKQSSWTPPGMAGPSAPPPLPAGFSTAIYAPAAPPAVAQKAPVAVSAKPRAKARQKDAIEGTPWLRITTADQTIFFYNSESKASVWLAPTEILDLVTKMDQEMAAAKRKAIEDELKARKAEAEAAAKATEAAQADEEDGDEDGEPTEEMSEEQLIELAQLRAEMDMQRGAAQKRPAEIQANGSKKKKPKIVHSLEEVEDEEWQREIAAEMAAEAEAEEDGEGTPAAMPSAQEEDPTAYSSEESRALFRSLLADSNVNPFAPWELELPKFVNDPRYSAVRKLGERRGIFEDYCRDKVREKKALKTGVKVDPAQAYHALLVAEVSSTRTHWEDFRRAHKKDARFRDFGRDDREREQAFKKWLRDLGEIKRADAQRHEEMFLELLMMTEDISATSKWSDVKKRLSSDPRYEAVGSSSLREGLFNKHLARLAKKAEEPNDDAKRTQDKKLRQAASLREREEKVKRERLAVERAAGRSRAEAGREEGERELRSLLIDSVRDYEVRVYAGKNERYWKIRVQSRWEDVLPRLQRDPRFSVGNLAPHEQRQLFEEHLEDLRVKRVDALEHLFERQAKRLDTPFSDVFPHIASDPAISRLTLSPDQVEHMFESWSRRRRTAARTDFDALLGESAFLEFWGRTRKEAIDKQAEEATRKALAGDEDEVVDEPDLRAMARLVDLAQIHAALRHDSRYRAFDFLPEERERWIRDYLQELAAPSQTVHQRR